MGADRTKGLTGEAEEREKLAEGECVDCPGVEPLECRVGLARSWLGFRDCEETRLWEEEFKAREENRTGEDSRDETAEFVVDAVVEGAGIFGESQGNWEVICGLAAVLLTAPSLADRCTGSDAASASLAPLDRPEVPLVRGGLSDSAVISSTQYGLTRRRSVRRPEREPASWAETGLGKGGIGKAPEGLDGEEMSCSWQ